MDDQHVQVCWLIQCLLTCFLLQRWYPPSCFSHEERREPGSFSTFYKGTDPILTHLPEAHTVILSVTMGIKLPYKNVVGTLLDHSTGIIL